MFARRYPEWATTEDLTSPLKRCRSHSPEPDSGRRIVRIIDVTTFEDATKNAKETQNNILGCNSRRAADEQKTYQNLAGYIEELLGDVATRQECQGQPKRSLILVAEGSAVSVASQVLHRADRDSGRRSDVCISMMESTYGVIRLQNHHRKFLHSWILAVGQASLYWLLRNYDISRDPATKHMAVPLPYTAVLRNPSTGIFVICALLYGVFAMLQYHVNRTDSFQQLCLVIGLAVGVLLSPSLPLTVPESPVSVHIFAITTSVALVCSACGHWVWRTFFSTREARLEKKLVEWRRDARDVDESTHVIKFCELA